MIDQIPRRESWGKAIERRNPCDPAIKVCDAFPSGTNSVSGISVKGGTGGADGLRHQRALTQLASFALGCQNLDALLAHACAIALAALEADAVAIWELRPEGNAWILRGRAGRPASALTSARVQVEPENHVAIDGAEAGTIFGVLQIGYRPLDRGGDKDFVGSFVELLGAAVRRLRRDADETHRRERLSVALEVGEIGSLEIDLKAGSITWTARHDEIFGVADPTAQWTYHTLMERVLREDRDTVNDSFCRAVDTQTEWRCEFRIARSNDGAIRWVEARGRPSGPAGGPASHLIGVLADVTERKQAQRSLQKSNELLEARILAQQREQEIEARFSFAAQAGQLGVWELDMRTGALNASKVCHDHFGHHGEHAFNYVRLLDAIHPQDRESIRTALEQCASHGAEFDVECRVTRSNGNHGWVQMKGQGVSTPDAASTRIGNARLAGISFDITERVHGEERIRKSQRVEAVGRLTAGVAHDFNNVLQVLLGGLELATEDAQDRPELRANLDLAMQAGLRGARLTSHLLSFSRQQVLHPTPLMLLRLLRELARTLERTLGHDIAVRVSVAPGLPRVLADASYLDSALLNLALNARDAMPQGGELRIDAFERAEHVVIAVSDSGQGMTPDVLAHACEPFFSTKGTTGSGLGLSMAQGFASQSGGELRIQSAVEQGTRVEICLPIAATAAQTAPAIKTDVPRGRGSVLVVDDDADVARITAVFMRKAGFDVTSVGSSNQALSELCLGSRFDALVTDFAMPGMNGTDLVLEARELHADLPALVITGYAGAEGLERLPADVGILRKPFQRERLIETVASMVARRPRAVAASAAAPAA